MIHHVLLATLEDGVAEADVWSLVDGLSAIAREASGVLDYRIERDARLREGNDDLVLIARFDGEESFRAYLAHPRHVALLRELAPRLLAGSHQAQFVTDDRLPDGLAPDGRESDGLAP